MSSKDKKIERTTEDTSGASEISVDSSQGSLASSPVTEAGDIDPARSEREHLMTAMRQALAADERTSNEDRLNEIERRIESGYYSGEAEQSEIVSKMLQDLLGTEPF